MAKENKKKVLPEQINPQLATLVTDPPKGKEWIHEIKWDGYRLIAMIKDKVKLVTRGHKDWTQVFNVIAKELAKLKLKNTILDGEVVALDNKDRSDFQLLQNSIKTEDQNNLYYYVFDLIYYQGQDLSALELGQRKKILKKLLANYKGDVIRYSDHVVGNGDAVYQKACQYNLEGIISKNIHSHYTQKRTRTWQKIKCSQRETFVVGGYTKGKGAREQLGSLVLGYYNKKKQLIYCGQVGTGFTQKSLEEIFLLMNRYKTKQCSFHDKPAIKNLISWLKPKIKIEVEFTEWTDEGILRHPSFKREKKS